MPVLIVLACALSALPAQPGPGTPDRDLQRVASDARTADLRGDWYGLMRAHDAVARRTPGPWVNYYLGYIDWRASSLAFMAEGATGMVALLDEAATHLKAALDAAPAFTEARLLLVMAHGGVVNNDPRRAGGLMPELRSNITTVFAEAPDNPRVKFLKAFLGFYAPGRSRADKDAALADWRRAAESFPQRPPANEPEWGRAEVWAWLGGTLLSDGKPAQAREAVQRALQDRKDFWWAREIALPQATHPRQHVTAGSDAVLPYGLEFVWQPGSSVP
jgi:tetratricopeptide (TPR) repeat protein